MAWRIILALILSGLITPTANYLSSDPTATAPTDVSKEVAARAQGHVDQMAKTYGIDPPKIRFVDSTAAGVTQKATEGPDKGKVLIFLGKPIQKPPYTEQNDLIESIAGHEFGHAVMMSRHQEFDLRLIILMYAVGLLPLLMVFRSKRDMAIAAVALTAFLLALEATPLLAIANEAYIAMLLLLIFVSGFGFFVQKDLAKIRALDKVRALLPSYKRLLAGAVTGFGLFAVTYLQVGGMNVEREIRADVIGACSTSPDSMRRALSAITGKPPQDNPTDVFHPKMSDRLSILAAMQDGEPHSKACHAMLDGHEPLTLAGHSIQ